MQVSVYITLKSGVLDPEGETLKQSLNRLDFDEVSEVRVGKYLELNVKEDDESRAVSRVEEMCESLLANPVIEDYRVELEAERDS